MVYPAASLPEIAYKRNATIIEVCVCLHSSRLNGPDRVGLACVIQPMADPFEPPQVNPEKNLWWADVTLLGTAADVLPRLVQETLIGESAAKSTGPAPGGGRA